MKKKRTFITNTVYYSILAIFIYIAVRYGVTLLMPFIIAFIVASLLRFPSVWIAGKLKISTKPVSIILVAAFYCLIAALILQTGSKLILAISGFVAQIPSMYREDILPFLNSAFYSARGAVYDIDPMLVTVMEQGYYTLTQSLGSMVTGISMQLVRTVSNWATELPAIIVKMILCIISTFFIAVDRDMIADFIRRILPQKAYDMMYQIKIYIGKILLVYLKSYSILIAMTFAELCAGFLILKIEKAVLLALVIAIVDILPVLGTGAVLIPWAAIMALNGSYRFAAGLMILYLVITMIRNSVEPRIVGSQIGLHPLVTLVSMFVGAQLLGIIGLFGFPVTLAILVSLSKAGVIRFLPQWEKEPEPIPKTEA